LALKDDENLRDLKSDFTDVIAFKNFDIQDVKKN